MRARARSITWKVPVQKLLNMIWLKFADDYVQELPNEFRLKFVNYVLYVYPSYIIHVMNYIIHVEDYYLS